MRTTIDAAGRIGVPKRMRAELGLSGSRELEITARDGHLEAEIPAVRMRLVERDGVPTAIPAERLPTLTASQVREALERSRR